MQLAITHVFLQNYWWFIISLTAAVLVLLMFVQGGQSFIFTLAKNEKQKTMIINTMGRKWESTFTTLVVFGGAFFASFPLFYAVSFGGAYWVWMLILFSFVIQAIAFEYRSKPSNVLGKRTFEIFLLINGILSPLLIGIALATFFTGASFSLNELNMSKWDNPWHGLEAVLNIRNISLGLTVLFLTRLLGLMYIINTIDDDKLLEAARRKLASNAIFFLAGFLYFTISLLLSRGFAVDPESGRVFMEKGKYLHNFMDMPLVSFMFLAGTALVLFALYRGIYSSKTDTIWFAAAGTLLVVLSLFLVAGYNNTAFYPSVTDLQSSLSIRNASSSLFTLKVMFYVSFIIPVVLAYTWHAWKAINKYRVSEEDVSGEGHSY